MGRDVNEETVQMNVAPRGISGWEDRAPSTGQVGGALRLFSVGPAVSLLDLHSFTSFTHSLVQLDMCQACPGH